MVAKSWWHWLEKYGQEKWGISEETYEKWSNLADGAGEVKMYTHPSIKVHETTKDGNCGYDALRIAMQELPEDERMSIQDMRNRVGDLVTQEHFETMQIACDDDEKAYLSKEATLKDYQDAIREGYLVDGKRHRKQVWIDAFAINTLLLECGIRAFIWSKSQNVKRLKFPLVRQKAMFYAFGDF